VATRSAIRRPAHVEPEESSRFPRIRCALDTIAHDDHTLHGNRERAGNVLQPNSSLSIRDVVAPHIRVSLAVAAVIVAVGCGSGSPTAPSGPPDIVVSDITVRSAGHFEGTGPEYSVCGSIRIAPAVTEDVLLHAMVLTLRDASGGVVLTWSDPTFFQRLPPSYGGVFGCFGGPVDPDPTHTLAATFVVRITYSRVVGPSRVIEVSGPVRAS
jgi:hypothetical protein